MGDRLFSNNDIEAAAKVQAFARVIAKEPERYGIRPAEAQILLAAAERFGARLQETRCPSSRTTMSTRRKNEARLEAKRLMERAARKIRAHDEVTPIMLHNLGLRPPSARRRRTPCPQEPPRLRFVRALHEGGAASPVHELEYRGLEAPRNRRPAGAERLELYMALVPPDAEVPPGPSAVFGEHPLHLGAFTRSPFKVEPRLGNAPMLIVYWGRWVGSNHDLGPWSATCATRIEGWPQHVWRGALGSHSVAPLMDASAALDAARRASNYSVSVRDAQYEYRDRSTALPDAGDAPQRRLEGPAESEAA